MSGYFGNASSLFGANGPTANTNAPSGNSNQAAGSSGNFFDTFTPSAFGNDGFQPPQQESFSSNGPPFAYQQQYANAQSSSYQQPNSFHSRPPEQSHQPPPNQFSPPQHAQPVNQRPVPQPTTSSVWGASATPAAQHIEPFNSSAQVNQPPPLAAANQFANPLSNTLPVQKQPTFLQSSQTNPTFPLGGPNANAPSFFDSFGDQQAQNMNAFATQPANNQFPQFNSASNAQPNSNQVPSFSPHPNQESVFNSNDRSSLQTNAMFTSSTDVGFSMGTTDFASSSTFNVAPSPFTAPMATFNPPSFDTFNNQFAHAPPQNQNQTSMNFYQQNMQSSAQQSPSQKNMFKSPVQNPAFSKSQSTHQPQQHVSPQQFATRSGSVNNIAQDFHGFSISDEGKRSQSTQELNWQTQQHSPHPNAPTDFARTVPHHQQTGPASFFEQNPQSSKSPYFQQDNSHAGGLQIMEMQSKQNSWIDTHNQEQHSKPSGQDAQPHEGAQHDSYNLMQNQLEMHGPSAFELGQQQQSHPFPPFDQQQYQGQKFSPSSQSENQNNLYSYEQQPNSVYQPVDGGIPASQEPATPFSEMQLQDNNGHRSSITDQMQPLDSSFDHPSGALQDYNASGSPANAFAAPPMPSTLAKSNRLSSVPTSTYSSVAAPVPPPLQRLQQQPSHNSSLRPASTPPESARHPSFEQGPTVPPFDVFRPSSAASVRSFNTTGSLTPTGMAAESPASVVPSTEAFYQNYANPHAQYANHSSHFSAEAYDNQEPTGHFLDQQAEPRSASPIERTGSAVAQPLQCKQCGTFNPAQGRFCAWCGSPLADSAPDPVMRYPHTPPPVAIPSVRGPFHTSLISPRVPICVFSPRGVLLTSFAKATLRYSSDPALNKPVTKLYPGNLRLQPVYQIIGDDLTKECPGPVMMRESKLSDTKIYICEWLGGVEEGLRDARVDSDEDREAIVDRTLLMRLLQKLVRSLPNKLDQQTTPVCSPSEAILDVLKQHLTSCQPSSSSPNGPVSSLGPLYLLLINGKLREAAQFCLSRSHWALALILASRVDRDLWQSSVAVYSAHGLLQQDSEEFSPKPIQLPTFSMPHQLQIHAPVSVPVLQFFMSLMGGATADAVSHILLPSDVAPAPPDSASLSAWRECVLLALMHQTDSSSDALVVLGDRLRAYGRTDAAAICHLVAGLPIFGGAHEAVTRQVLLGAPHVQVPLTFQMDASALYLTEIFEFYLAGCVGNMSPLSTKPVQLGPDASGVVESAILPHLQAYKLEHARRLLGRGHVNEARKYILSIIALVEWAHKITIPSGYLHPRFLVEMHTLADLIGIDKDGAAGSGNANWISKKFASGFGLDKLSKASLMDAMNRGLDKFVIGQEESNASKPPGPRAGSPIDVQGGVGSRPPASFAGNAYAAPGPYNPAPPGEQFMQGPHGAYSTGPAGQHLSENYGYPNGPMETGNAAAFSQNLAGYGPISPGYTKIASSAPPPQAPAASNYDQMPMDDFAGRRDGPTAPLVQDDSTNFDDDLGMGNRALKKQVAQAEDSATSTAPTARIEKDMSKIEGDEKSGMFGMVKSLFRRRASGPVAQTNASATGTPVKANLGEENTFYFDKGLGKWVNKKAGGDAGKSAVAPLPPPPKGAMSSSPVTRTSTPRIPHAPPMGPLPPVRPASSMGLGGASHAPMRGDTTRAYGMGMDIYASPQKVSPLANEDTLASDDVRNPLSKAHSQSYLPSGNGSLSGPASKGPSRPTSGPGMRQVPSRARTTTPANDSVMDPMDLLPAGMSPGPMSDRARNMRGRSKYVDVLAANGGSKGLPACATPPPQTMSFLPQTPSHLGGESIERPSSQQAASRWQAE